MTNKDRAKSFLKTAGMGEVQRAYDEYVHPQFLHHNLYFKGDRQSLLEAMKEAHKMSPNKNIEIKQIFEDGQSVITHSLVQQLEKDIAVVHIFKFEGDKIIELWDLGQFIEAESPNENGAF